MKKWLRCILVFVLALNSTGISFGNQKPKAASPAFSENTSAGSLLKSNNPTVQSVMLTGNVFLDGGNRLVATQNSDGGWGWPVTGTSAANTVGPIAMGLAHAYQRSGDASQQTALSKTGAYLLTKTNNFSPTDGYLAAKLDQIFGGTTYRNFVKTNFYDKLAAGTYNRNGAGTLYNTTTYVQLIRDNRTAAGIPNLAAWDLGLGLVSAADCGASTAEWIAGVEAKINELANGTLGAEQYYDVLGLAGAVYGLAYVHVNFDPTAGAYASAASLSDLADILATYQISNGGFTWNANHVSSGNETNQETAYAILALNAVNRARYLTKIQGAADYFKSVELGTGGWDNYVGDPDGENNELTGEILWGYSAVYSIHNSTQNIFYASIQTAVTNAAASNTILVDANSYGEIVTVNKALTITGTNSPSTTKFILSANPVSITGFDPATLIEVANGGDIQNALDATPPGGTVNVNGGGPYPHLTVNKPLTIDGHGAYVTHASPAITVNSDNVTITGFIFSYDAPDYAIQINPNFTNINIHSCNFNTPNAVNNLGTGSVDARNNFWGRGGNANGPTIASNPGGNGGVITIAVGGTVTYDPWYGKNVSPSLYAVGVSVAPNFTMTAAVTGTLQISSTTDFSSIVLSKSLTASSSYTFSNADLVGALAGQYQLLNNTTYYWRIYNSGTSTVVDPSSPPPPFENYYTFKTVSTSGINLTTPSNASTVSGGTLLFGWSVTSYGLIFDLQRDDGAGGAFTALASGISDWYYSYDSSLLTPGLTYRWRVIVKTPSGVVMNYSAIRTFTMSGLPQPLVSYPKATTVYETSPTLYWYLSTYNTSVTSYDVKYWRNDQADPGNPPVAQTNLVGSFNTATTNMYAVISATLDAGYTYNWQVRSTNGTQSSSWSTLTWFTVYSSVPGVAPVPYTSWPVGGATSYINPPTLYWYLGTYATGLYFYVEWSSDGFATVAGNSGWFADNLYYAMPTVLSSGTYSWHVKSRIGLAGSVSGWSTTATFVVPSSSSSSATVPVLTYPTGGMPVYVLNPTLNWYAYSTSSLEYQVRISTTSSVDGTGMLNNPLAVSSSSWTTSSSMDVATIPYALTAGALYYWEVRSRLLATPSVVSSWSYVGSFATSASSSAIVPMAVTPNFGQPINNTKALLSWSLPVKSSTHLNYDVEYSKSSDFRNSTVIKDVSNKVTSVDGLEKNTTYYWRVLSKNTEGTSNYSQAASFSTGTVTAVEETETIPSEYELSQNYPNPFNPSTKITFTLPQSVYVTLKVYDMLGREVKTLLSQEKNAGTYSIDWNADNDLGFKVASGMYVYRITAGNFVATKKMVLIK